MGIIASDLYIQNEYNVVFMYKLFLRHRPSEPFNLLHRGYTDFDKYLTALGTSNSTYFCVRSFNIQARSLMGKRPALDGRDYLLRREYSQPQYCWL